MPGSLWALRGKKSGAEPLVVLGNVVNDETGTIWCAGWDTGTRYDLNPTELRRLPETKQPTWEEVCSRCAGWAAKGDHHSAWWLGWAYEGVNHARSIWYYVASLRMTRGKPSWAWPRIYDDTFSGSMCPNIPHPSLEFLKEIPEFNGAKEWGEWQPAIRHAEIAEHVPASEEAYRRAAKMNNELEQGTLEGHTYRSILRSCAVTTQGLAAWERTQAAEMTTGPFEFELVTEDGKPISLEFTRQEQAARRFRRRRRFDPFELSLKEKREARFQRESSRLRLKGPKSS